MTEVGLLAGVQRGVDELHASPTGQSSPTPQLRTSGMDHCGVGIAESVLAHFDTNADRRRSRQCDD
jgi:hypothetical protein